jgi:hypothetical protein
MDIKFLKENLKKIDFHWFNSIAKNSLFMGLLSVLLAVSIAVYAFLDFDIRVKRGPLLRVLFISDEVRKQRPADEQLAQLETEVVPSSGVILPVVWGDLGNDLWGQE